MLIEVTAMKRPDLLILVAIWEFISAFLAVLGLFAISIFAFPAVLGVLGKPVAGGVVGLGFAGLILLAGGGLGVAAGIGVLAGRDWGRVLALIHAVLSLFYIPIGTAAGVLVLVYLTRPEVTAYFRGPQDAGNASPGDSPGT